MENVKIFLPKAFKLSSDEVTCETRTLLRDNIKINFRSILALFGTQSSIF